MHGQFNHGDIHSKYLEHPQIPHLLCALVVKVQEVVPIHWPVFEHLHPVVIHEKLASHVLVVDSKLLQHPWFISLRGQIADVSCFFFMPLLAFGLGIRQQMGMYYLSNAALDAEATEACLAHPPM